MKTLIYFLFFTFPGILAAQSGCDNCYLCEWVYNSRGEKVLFHTLEEAQGLTGGLGGKEQHRKTGSYDQNCINQLKQQQTQAEADRKKFEASKEKAKNGEIVVDWYNSGKASRSMKNVNDPYNNITWYNSNGIMTQRFVNNKLFVYKDGKLDWEGPAIAANYPGTNTIVYLQHGYWKIDDSQYVLYVNGANKSTEFKKLLNNANSIQDIEELKRNFPFPEIFILIEEKRKQIEKQNTLKDKYNKMYNEAFNIFTYESFKKFNEAFPDSTGFTMGLMKLLDPNKLTDTLSFTFSNTNKQKLKVLENILFKDVKEKAYCFDDDKLLIDCFFDPEIEWSYYGDCKKGYSEIYICQVYISLKNGLKEKAQLYKDDLRLGEIKYVNDELKSIWYRNYSCQERNKTVFYKDGAYYFKIINREIEYNDKEGKKVIYELDIYDQKKLIDFIQKADKDILNEYFQYCLTKYPFENDNVNKKWVSTVVDFYRTLIVAQFDSGLSSGENARKYSEAAISFFNKYKGTDYVPEYSKWEFEILKAFAYWKDNDINSALEVLKPNIENEITEKVYHSYDSGFSFQKHKYRDYIKKYYDFFKEYNVVFPDEKANWKKIKSLN